MARQTFGLVGDYGCSDSEDGSDSDGHNATTRTVDVVPATITEESDKNTGDKRTC
jgi:hypothetical protein